MQRSPRALVALYTLSIMLWVPAARATAAPRHSPRLPSDYVAWTRVADCESGGWQVLGAAYPDALGIDATNWQASGGRPQPPGRVTLADRILEIRVADRFTRRYGISIPDAHGCAPW